MVANRNSISKLGIPLCELIIEGGGTSTRATELAGKLLTILNRAPTYVKQYKTHEERVLHRHLNLYLSKAKKAKTETERLSWQGKAAAQKRKIRAWEASQNETPEATGNTLDLDGL